MTQDTEDVVARLQRTKTQYRTYGAFGGIGIQDETESREVPINPDGPDAIKLIQSLSDRIDELEGTNKQLQIDRVTILALMFNITPATVAKMCEHLDKSGALLGMVRETADRAALHQEGISG